MEKTSEDYRKEFLMKMYEQMCNEINRHILTVWQSVSALLGAVAIVALTGKELITLDMAAALLILNSIWLLYHVLDANYWYNRNLAIVSNIERQFLSKEDLKNIHYYFGRHRESNSILTNLRIQLWLGFMIAALALAYHLFVRILPNIVIKITGFEVTSILPYLLAGYGIFKLWTFRDKRNRDYKEFIVNSPGIQVDDSGISYGGGHPVDNGTKK